MFQQQQQQEQQQVLVNVESRLGHMIEINYSVQNMQKKKKKPVSELTLWTVFKAWLFVICT